MDRQTSGRTKGWIGKWTDRGIDRRAKGQRDEEDRWMEGQTNGWVEGWMDGWTDGRILWRDGETNRWMDTQTDEGEADRQTHGQMKERQIV